MRFRPQILRLALAPALLAAMAACGGGDSGAKDPAALIQEGDIAAALATIEDQKAAVEPGSPEHLDLVLLQVKAEAMQAQDAADAGDEDPELGNSEASFLAFAEQHPDAATPKQYQYAVSELRTHRQYASAIAVMDKGLKRWPEDEVMNKLLALLQADAEKDEGAAAALKGLGYTSK